MRTLRSVVGLVAIAAASLACAAAMAMQSAPVPSDAPGYDAEPTKGTRGEATFRTLCSECHEHQYASQFRLDRGGWTQVMDRMASNGFVASPEDKGLILDYLTATYGPDK